MEVLMIERTVFLKLNEELCNPEERLRVAEHSYQVLSAIPGVVAVRTGAATSDTTSDWDVLLVVGFETADDMEQYRVHPDHRAFVDNYLRPRLAAIKAWSFQLT
jgi:hypothetical protein